MQQKHCHLETDDVPRLMVGNYQNGIETKLGGRFHLRSMLEFAEFWVSVVLGSFKLFLYKVP